jgi:hypothetical protein
MQGRAWTTTSGRRSSSNRMARGSPYPFGRGWACRRSNGPIRPRSSGAWPDPALFFYIYMNFYDGFVLLYSKLLIKSSRHQKMVIQISLWSLQYCLASSTASMIFRAMDIIWGLFVVDLGFYHLKSKSEVLYYEIVWFQFSVMPCFIVKLEKLDLLF